MSGNSVKINFQRVHIQIKKIKIKQTNKMNEGGGGGRVTASGKKIRNKRITASARDQQHSSNSSNSTSVVSSLIENENARSEEEQKRKIEELRKKREEAKEKKDSESSNTNNNNNNTDLDDQDDPLLLKKMTDNAKRRNASLEVFPMTGTEETSLAINHETVREKELVGILHRYLAMLCTEAEETFMAEKSLSRVPQLEDVLRWPDGRLLFAKALDRLLERVIPSLI